MKRKLVSILLAASMVVSICACGEKEQPHQESSETKQESSVTQQSSEVESEVKVEDDSLYPLVDEEVTVKGVFITSGDQNPSRLVWDKVSEVTGINIEWEFVANEALATYLAGGEWPDFFHGYFPDNLTYDYGALGGKFVNYLDYLDVMPHLVQTFEDYPSLKEGGLSANGGLYRLPYLDVSTTSTNVRPYVRTDVLEAAGVEMPTTVDEFAQALRDLKEYYGVASFSPRLNRLDYGWDPMLYAAFGTGCNPYWDIDDAGNVYYPAMSEQMKHFYEWMNSLYEEGLLFEECATLDESSISAMELEGKMAFVDYAASSIPEDENGEWHIDSMAPLTSEYDSTQEVLGVVPGEYNKGTFLINAESEYVKELCQMIDIAYATEEVVEGTGLQGESFMYGLEGKDWVKNDDGQSYTFIFDQNKYASFNEYQMQELIFIQMGRADALKGLVTDTASNNQARQLSFANNVWPYSEIDPFPLNRLTFDEEQQYVLDNKMTEINNYVGQMRVEFIIGVTDIAEGWDAYCAKLKDMGIDEVVAIYQASYDKLMGN